uniref:Uncharacterized protein n=1 Tax=Rhizophora mucronata TaxID=61149 RepID=A0A2P2IZM8_RHIMU
MLKDQPCKLFRIRLPF